MNFELIPKIDKLYYTFQIPKGNGKFRKITAPTEELKQAQREVLRSLSHIKVSRDAMGFTEGKSIVTNARKHLGKPFIMNIDMKDFFPSITWGMVVRALIREGVGEDLAKNIAWLCTLDGVLPQGAPTSPFLSNIVCKPMDKKISKLCTNVTYTRYADDITLSGEKEQVLSTLEKVVEVIKSYGLRINYKKVHGFTAAYRQEVTGIVVNQKTNVNRDNILKFRAKLHNILCAIRDGLITTEQDIVDQFDEDIMSLQGYASFISSVNKSKGKLYLDKVNELSKMLKILDKSTL
jgi:retron-type reverse transcriptase